MPSHDDSLVPVVQELWNAWEIHFMILLSLSLQVFLFLFAGLRRRSSSRFLQTVLWLAYLAADSVAVFVLGHLAVRAREPGHELMAFWAPFMLVHLGGQDTITAFAKQDNDLWRRHLLNLVIQAGVAGYVVAKASWPDAHLRAAMVIMFVCGCFKYAERVHCLWLGSKEWLKGVTQLGGEDQDFSGWERRSLEERKRDMSDTLDLMSKASRSWRRPPSALHSDAGTIREDIIFVDAPLNKAGNITLAAADDGKILPGMLRVLQSSESRHNAYEYVGAVLEYCYRQLYTKDLIRFLYFQSVCKWVDPPILQTCLCLFTSLFFILVSAVASSIALVLFIMSVHKWERDPDQQLHTTNNSNRVDIMVTYALLVGAIVLDVSSAASLIFLQLSVYLHPCLATNSSIDPQSTVTCCCAKQQCSQELGQYIICTSSNVVALTLLSPVCDVLKCKPVTKVHMPIKKFILDTLLSSGTRKEWTIASTRGRLAIKKWMMDNCQNQKNDGNQQSAHHHHLATTTKRLKSLEEIIASSADFLTSVLVVHIATEICYYSAGDTNSTDHQAVKEHKQTSTQLSNYIMYLIFKCGVMLTTNSRIVHDSALREIRRVLPMDRRFWYNLLFDQNIKDDTLNLFDEIKKQQQDSMVEIEMMHQESSEEQQHAPTEMIKLQESADNDGNAAHIKELQTNSQTLTSPVLPRAIAVAHELLGIKNEAERWELIAKVWAEMLYYIAPRCGGDFHYEHLSTGGEFVTHVLLLMYYLGPFLPPSS